MNDPQTPNEALGNLFLGPKQIIAALEHRNALLKQCDEWRDALKSIVAALSQPVQYTDSPKDATTVDILRGDCTFARQIAKSALTVCHECGDSGVIDSGGMTPLGTAINLPCPSCTHLTAKLNALRDASLMAANWFSHSTRTDDLETTSELRLAIEASTVQEDK